MEGDEQNEPAIRFIKESPARWIIEIKNDNPGEQLCCEAIIGQLVYELNHLAKFGMTMIGKF